MAAVDPRVHRRNEYWHDPNAPTANSLVPAAMLLVIDAEGRLLLQCRRDTGQWAIPGGKQELGEAPSTCAVREAEEETGVRARVTGLLGVFSDPDHVVEYTSDGEVRQEFEITLLGEPVSGNPSGTAESSHAAWIAPHELDNYDIHPTMRRQIDAYLSGSYPVVD